MSPEQERHSEDQTQELPSTVQFEQIPQELYDFPQWVCWRFVARGEGKKPDKQPVNPRTLGNAGVHWVNTWSTGEQAYMTYLNHAGRGIDGIGFVLTKEDPYVGLDLDRCLQDDFITLVAHQTVMQFMTYTEISPSRQGLRLLVKNAEFGRNVRTPQLEVYAHSRFLTLTGNRLPVTPPEIREVALAELAQVVPATPLPVASQTVEKSEHHSLSVAPEQLWERIFEHDQYGEDHHQRFLGNTTLDRGDHSLTVLRLLNALARWTGGDAQTMRRMMLLSPLANEKWFSKRGKQDWLDYQIVDAIAYVRGRK